MSLKSWGIMPIIFLYMIFPLTFSSAKTAALYTPILFFIGLRLIISGLLLLLYLYAQRQSLTIQKKDYADFFKIILTGIILTFIPEYTALASTTIAKTAFLFTLTPFFTFLLSYRYGLEGLSIKKIIGLCVGIIGIVPLILQTTDLTSLTLGFSLPDVLILFSVINYAYSWVKVKKLLTYRSYSPLLINGWMQFIGGIGVTAYSLYFDYYKKLPCTLVTNWPLVSVYLFYIIIVGLICYTLYGYLLKEYSATLVSFFVCTEPLFASLYGWLLFRETVTQFFFIATFIVTVGLYIFYQEEFSKKNYKGTLS